MNNECLVHYSGGTDSTCVVALLAKEYSTIHLNTYIEFGTKNSPVPTANIDILKNHFPKTKFIQNTIYVDESIKLLTFKNFFKNLLKYHFLNLSNTGNSTMSWHIESIAYCLKNNINKVYDGLTNELLHLPGHMDFFITMSKKLYNSYGITYSNPVRNWETPKEQQIIDRIVVDQHGYLFPTERDQHKLKKTTGSYLFHHNIFNNENIKGSNQDFKMQHNCYPFILYNIMLFWIFLNLMSFEQYTERLRQYFEDKLPLVNELIHIKTR